MSNTDGEDIQRIEDLDRKMWAIVQATPTFSSNPEDYLKPWRELINQKLASLREQLKEKHDNEKDELQDKFDTLDDEYQELVKFSTMIFRGIPRFELTALMSPDDFEKFKNHLGV